MLVKTAGNLTGAMSNIDLFVESKYIVAYVSVIDAGIMAVGFYKCIYLFVGSWFLDSLRLAMA